MKVYSLAKESSAIGSSERDSLSGVAALAKQVFTRTLVYGDEEDKISYWQLIFLQSKAYGCSYRGEDLPHIKWQWPRDTWFQEQLSHHLKDRELAAHQSEELKMSATTVPVGSKVAFHGGDPKAMQ